MERIRQTILLIWTLLVIAVFFVPIMVIAVAIDLEGWTRRIHQRIV